MERIGLDRLEPDPENVRRVRPSEGEVAELAASIAAQGLLQNLVVRRKPRTKTKYLVTAGGSRLAALRLLVAEGRLPADHTVPCTVVEAASGTELSLAENLCRREMAPVDAFEAFARLRDAGQDVAEIAARFGLSEDLVRRRLRLGDLAPELREAMRAGHLGLDAAMAFARRTDPDLQLSVWRALGGAVETPFRESVYTIRRRMDAGGVSATTTRARFVGLDAYVAAGGGFERDLFAEEGEGVLTDPALLDRLVADKLAGAAGEIAAEGWAWVEPVEELSWEVTSQLGRVYPEPVPDAALDREEAALQARMAALETAAAEDDRPYTDEEDAERAGIEERLDAIEAAREVAYATEDIARAGAFVTIGHDGGLRVERGLVRPEDAVAKVESDADRAGPDVDGTDADAAGQGGAKPFSAALLRDLAEARTRVLQVRLAAAPAAARDLVTFVLAMDLLGRGHRSHGLDLSVRRDRIPAEEDRGPATRAFHGARDALDLGWLGAETMEAQFTAFLALAEERRDAILAWCTGALVVPQLAGKDAAAMLEITGARIGTEVRSLWTPSAETLFARLSKAQILAVLADCGGEAFAARHAAMKKGDLVDLAERFFAGEVERVSEGAGPAAETWLPPGMAYGADAEPEAEDRENAADDDGAPGPGDGEDANLQVPDPEIAA